MLKPKIVVLGCGGAGGNAVNTMIQSELQGVEFVVANTDAQALAQSLAETRIQLGSTATQGLGAGSKPEVGRAAAEESLSEVLAAVENANLVFIAAGMGGGTGTGSAPVIAQAIREQGILTVAVVTKPFHFEGQHRMRVAERGIEELQANVDTLIIVPNQNLFRVANERTTFADAFKMADDVLYEGVRGISDLMVQPGLINLDFADVRALMTVMGKAMMGLGEGHGECRAIEAAEAAIANPLLEDGTMRGAKGVLINIAGGPDLTLFEVDEAANRIREEVDPDANIIFGSSFDPVLQGRIRVSVVATGIDPESVRLGQHPAGQQVAADPAAAAQPTRWATITPDAPGKATSIASDKAAAAPQPVPQRLTPTPVAAMHAHGPSAARPLPKPVAALRPNAPAASQPQAAHRPSAQPFAGQPVAMASPRPTAAAAYYPGQGSQGPSVDEGYDGYEGYEAFDAYAEDLPEGLAANPGYAADDYEAAAQQPAMMAAHHSAVHQGPTHQGPAHQGPAHQEAAYHEATRYGAVHAQAAPRMAPLAPQPQRQPTLRPVEPAALTAHANDRAAFHPDHQAEPRRGLARAGGLFQRLQQFSRNAGFGAEPEPSASYQEQPARAGYPGGPFAGPNGGPNGGPHGGPNGGGQRAARPAPAPMTQAAAHAGSQPGGQFVRPVPQQDYAAAAGYQQPAHRAISVSSLESHLPPVQAPREIEDDLLEIPAFLRRQAN